MVKVRNYKPTGEGLDEPAVALFEEQWQLYRKFVDNNYLYHREVYGQLHRILVHEAAQPFRFLDIACGDARATVDHCRRQERLPKSGAFRCRQDS